MTANERVKVLRKSLNLSGEKFGAALGVKKNAISQIENGINNISPQMFKSICREFNIREEWLRDGIEPMRNERSKDKKLEVFFDEVLADDNSFRKDFLLTLAQLDVSEWKIAEQFFEAMFANWKKDV